MPELFHLVMIKPTHYDDDGYPIQWLRSAIPSNTLACLNGLALDSKARAALGPDVELKLHTFDETNRRVRPERIVRDLRNAGGRVLVALVGVQSNQYPRALDLAKVFRRLGVDVCIGGFHVSGCLAMLPEVPAELKEAQDLGIALFAGEAEEGRLDEVLRDACADTLKPLYNWMSDLPGMAGEPPPMLPRKHLRRTARAMSSVDLGRGCPFQCSFCTIINVQGRKSRFRTADDLERIVRENRAQNIKSFFITDDNFARNRSWEAFFDRLIELRERERIRVNLTIQVDTLCHKIPGFIEKAARAGTRHCFIGLENINPDSLLTAKKRQNRITDYREMILAWKKQRVIAYAGYILGFPNDTKETILRDIEIIKRELPIDMLEFFYLTPLPGSEDHKVLLEKGVWMDPDLNKYDLNHRVCHHPRMSDEEWDSAHDAAWRAFYTPKHLKTVIRRSVACGLDPKQLAIMLSWFVTAVLHEGVHPLESGWLRLKYRTDRRPGLARESALVFYPRYLWEIVARQVMAGYWLAKTYRYTRQALWFKDRDRSRDDVALQVPSDGDLDDLDLFQETRGGQQAVAKKLREDAAREALRATGAAGEARA